MSGRADRERAEAGQIFRDGKLQDRATWEKAEERARTMLKFMRGRRYKYDAKKHLPGPCPECQTPGPMMVLRVPGTFESLCRKCYHVWTRPMA